ncbi:MAG: hypothetical protein ACRDVG_06545 [Jatrophihabitantaceae bacterium]
MSRSTCIKSLVAAVVSLAVTVPAAVAATGGTANHAFACYSHGQGDPGVWESSDAAVFAADDYAKGYWRPWAVKENVSSTQIGDYHLTCTLPSGMADSGTYVTDGGDVIGANVANADGALAVGVYPIAEAAGAGPALVAQFGFDANGSGACGPPAKDFTIVLTQNGQPVSSLQPGTYWLTVTDHCANHNFALRSCPGSTAACGPNSGGVEQQVTGVNEAVGAETIKIGLVPGTYRLFCDAVNAAGVSHEILFNMYTDFVVGRAAKN